MRCGPTRDAGERTREASTWTVRLAMPEFFAPLPLTAVALMAVNDRWWKPAYPGALTGKVSDLAICFFLPLFVSAVLGVLMHAAPRGRLAAGAATTALVFTLLELWRPSADWFCNRALPLMGAPLGLHGPFRMVSDPTDLAALAMVPFAFCYGLARTRLRRTEEEGPA